MMTSAFGWCFVMIVLVEAFHLGNGILELCNSASALEVLNCLGGCAAEVKLVFFFFRSVCFAFSATEHIRVFLLWEVHVIVSVWMRVLRGVPPIVLIPAVASQILSVVPGLELEVAHRSALVEVADCHCAFVSFVVDRLSTQHMLLLLTKTVKDMVWTNFHDVYFLFEACFLVGLINA